MAIACVLKKISAFSEKYMAMIEGKEILTHLMSD